MSILLIILAMNGGKELQIRYTETPPSIDGIIENVWQKADSATGFTQIRPYEGKQASEKTAVLALQDDENLYFAFRCYADSLKPVACYTGNEGHVKVAIDPFGNRTTAYYFQVHASGLKREGWLLDDGRTSDESWNGVWYRAVKIYDDRYIVEMKIPFKSIRYKEGLEEWGLQFERYIACGREDSYWTEITEMEENMVSKFGILNNVKPQATGYYFELYPEGVLRYDNYRDEEGEFKPLLSLNFKWDISSQTTLNSTVNPDFAQIESDPFTLNLSRYPVYLDERRPFFLEGQDIFRMSDFGEGKGFYTPLNIFYSRKIGKSIDGEPVPILGGLKMTHKTENWDLGILGAYTDEFSENDTLIEPERSFAVMRTKHDLFENSDVGLLFSGTMTDENDYNFAYGMDAVYRSGISQFIIQSAISDRNGKNGWATSACYFGWLGNMLSIISGEMVDDSFDVSDMGYVPWSGRKQFKFLIGPFNNYKKGSIRNLFVSSGVMTSQNPGNDKWSKLFALMINPNFRNYWGFNLELMAGPYYENEFNYIYRASNLSVWGNGKNYGINFGLNYSYTYNYRRGYLADQVSGWLSGHYTLTSPLSLSANANFWAEWDTLGSLEAITPRFTPRINFYINADMKIQLFNEFVFEIPGSDFSNSEMITNRLGFLFSWNFKPKSWIYIALNDHRARDNGSLELQNQVAAVKAKYLLYF